VIIRQWDKLFKILVGMLVIFSVTFGVCAFWLLWPYDPITIRSIVLTNENKTIRQGECLRYRVTGFKHTDKPGRLMRYWVNGHKFPLEDDTDGGSLVQGPKGPIDVEIILKTPEITPVGTGRMQWSVAYQMNPLRNFHVPPAYSDEGRVVAK
jgi:hypothetical protein